MKLVIAEKPSVAQSLAAVIGATARKDGYLEGGGWRVSWCVGHLAGLADADAYNPDYAKWRYDDLPILPEHWQMVVSKDKKKQFEVLKQLMNAPDVTEVVNACDAGREGELIFRSVYELAGCQKPMKRLWISSMEDSAIREGFANANRLLGYTAQQTLDYLQNLYEKKLCTYPRTDSRYLTSDMAASLPELVRLTAGALPFAGGMEISCNAAQVINDKKVTDHHAVIPTRNLQGADLSGLPLGEKAVLELVALRLLCAVAQPYTFAETAATVECAGAEFTAKGRTVKNHGWRALDAAYRAGLKNSEPDKEAEDKALPELSEGQTLPLSGAAVKEGKTTPPKHFTDVIFCERKEWIGIEERSSA